MTRKELVDEIIHETKSAAFVNQSKCRRRLNKLLKDFANDCYAEGYRDCKNSDHINEWAQITKDEH